MERLARPAVLTLLAFVTASRAFATTTAESRQHFRLIDSRTGTAAVVTQITSLPRPAFERVTFLYEEAGDRLRLSHARDYTVQTAVIEIVDTATNEFARATIRYPYESTTRDATAREAEANAALAQWDTAVEVEINGVRAEHRRSQWLDRGSRDPRSNVRRAAGVVFLDRLERLRAFTGGSSPLKSFCEHLLRYLLNNETCGAAVSQVQADPDCQFDASFRYACSERQRDAIARAAAAGTPLRYY